MNLMPFDKNSNLLKISPLIFFFPVKVQPCVMTKGRKEKIHMKPVARVVQVSTSQQRSGSESSDSDDSFFDEDGRKDAHDDDSVFDDEKDGEGGGDGDDKDADGSGAAKDTKDGEPGGKSARILTMDEIRR